MAYNQDAWRMVKAKVEETAAAAKTAAEETAAAALAGLFDGKGDTLPTAKAGVVGHLFLRTGATDPGLYVCTATTTSASTWKAVSHAS